jgi:hypothetical protein
LEDKRLPSFFNPAKIAGSNLADPLIKAAGKSAEDIRLK